MNSADNYNMDYDDNDDAYDEQPPQQEDEDQEEPETQPTQSTQQASQHTQPSVDAHLWGYLHPCSGSLTRIDFWRMHPRYSVGRNGELNQVVLPGFKVSKYDHLRSSPLFLRTEHRQSALHYHLGWERRRKLFCHRT